MKPVLLLVGLLMLVAAACSDASPIEQPGSLPPRLTTLPPIVTTTTTTTTVTSMTTTTTVQPRPPLPPPPEVAAGETLCDRYAETARVVGQVAAEGLTETSGIAASRRYPGVIWAHNDSGGGARIFAIGPAGSELASYEIEGVLAFDWEDMAIGPGPDPGRDYLYLGDIGDNLRIRDTITLYRIPEPDPTAGGDVITGFTPLRLTFPGEPEDSEAVLVDPVSGDVLVITKRTLTRILRAPGDELGEDPVEMEEIHNVELGEAVTAADISPNGDRIVFRGYGAVWVWPRLDLEFETTFASAPCNATAPEELQGEAIALHPEGGYFTISEGVAPVINFVPEG